jgi:hypothetical protein
VFRIEFRISDRPQPLAQHFFERAAEGEGKGVLGLQKESSCGQFDEDVVYRPVHLQGNGDHLRISV